MRSTLLSSFNLFKVSLITEKTLNRRRSLAFLRMFRKFGFRIAIIIFLIPLNSGVLKAQPPAKKDTAKAKYQYFVKVPAIEYQQIIGALNDYKRTCMYDNMLTPEQKQNQFQGIEKYLRDLQGKVKIDSVSDGLAF